MELVDNLGEDAPKRKVLVNAIKSVEDLRNNDIQMENDILLFAEIEDVSNFVEYVKSIMAPRNESPLPLKH